MRLGAHSAAEREAALLKAEQDRVPATATSVVLQPSQIKVMPELFQPREFSYGLHELDTAHVNDLAKVIEINGTVDPVLVIRIKRAGWVVVDGHHSIAAYKKLGSG